MYICRGGVFFRSAATYVEPKQNKRTRCARIGLAQFSAFFRGGWRAGLVVGFGADGGCEMVMRL